MAADRKSTWVRPAARPLTAGDSRADVEDVAAPNGIAISNPAN